MVQILVVVANTPERPWRTDVEKGFGVNSRLNTSQSILRLKGSLNQVFGDLTFLEKQNADRKGIWFIFQNW